MPLDTRLKACDECGVGFKPYRPNKSRFCSKSCSIKHWNRVEKEKKLREVIEIECRECHTLFKPTRSMKLLCSDVCRTNYRLSLFVQRDGKIKGVIPCEVCGTEFTQRAITSKYCSTHCRQVGHIRLGKANRQKDPTKQNAYHAAYRKKNNLAVRNSRLRNWYGISPEEYEAMLENQGHKCAICGDAFSSTDRKFKPHVDHDHGPGAKVRQILCSRCNQGLGMFQDSVERLKSAIAYLEHHAFQSQLTLLATELQSTITAGINATPPIGDRNRHALH